MADIVALDIPPGLVSNGTALQTSGYWRDGNLVRWRNKIMQPVGGWIKALPDQLVGSATAIVAWQYGRTGKRGAIGTTDKLYSYDGLSLHDITPATLAPGRRDTLAGAGYGAGLYGKGTYGTERTATGLTFDAATWSLGTWGDQLVGVRRDDGTVWKWDPATDATAVAVTNAPTGLGLLVTDERHLIVFGASDDPRSVAWCDAEDYTNWTPAATNSAGSLLLSTQGRYMGAAKSRYGTLVLTDQDAHVLRYVAQPYVYGIERESSGCGVFGANAIIDTEQGLAWMGPDGFFLFTGAVAEIPCPVYDHVFSDINAQQGLKVAAGRIAEFDEVWWFYPSQSSQVNDRYVIWNYRENSWSFGKLGRAAWIDQTVFDTPLAVGTDGYLYKHETGWTADGVERDVYAESSSLNIADGAKIMYAGQIINDEGGGAYRLTAYARFTPDGTEYAFGPYTMRPDGYTDVRFSGRELRLRFTGTSADLWRVGKLRLAGRASGAR